MHHPWTRPSGQAENVRIVSGTWSDAVIRPASNETASRRGPVWEFADRVHINAACSRHVRAYWFSRSRLTDRCAITLLLLAPRPHSRGRLTPPRPELGIRRL